MAEGRMLKKEISDSKKLGRLKSDRPRVLYFMMLPHLDRDGRLKADPCQIKGQICTMLHYSANSIQKALEQLNEVGLLVLYKAEGKQYVQYTRFNDFQTFNYDRESESKIPAPTHEDSGVIRRTPLKLREVNLSKDNRIYVIFEHWNLYKGQGNWKSHREITPEIEEAINERLKKYSIEKLKTAITNYADILLSPQFVWSKNWTLREFLTRHRPDDRNELQIYRFLENNFSPDDFKRKEGCSGDKTDRSHIRQECKEKILDADHDKLMAVRQDAHHKDKAFLIDELRPEIIAEILAERKE